MTGDMQLLPAGSAILNSPDSTHSDRIRRGSHTEALPHFDYLPLEPDTSSLRRASLYHRLVKSVHASPVDSPNLSSTDLTDLRQRRRSHGSDASTIVNDPYLLSAPEPSSSRGMRSTSDSRSGRSSIDGMYQSAGRESSREPTPDGTGHRKSGKFSIAAAFRGLSRPRGVSKGRFPSGPELALVPESPASGRRGSGSSISGHIRGDDSPTGVRSVSFDQDAAPYGRGAAGSRSTPRTASPAGTRRNSPDRARGRHVGMKLLTDKLRGTGDHEDTEEDAHNWKEFRKGQYGCTGQGGA